MKLCTITFTNPHNTQQKETATVLVDDSADKYDIHTHYEANSWVITGIEVHEESFKVFTLD